MIDFPMDSASVYTELYCIILYLIVLIPNYKYTVLYPFKYNISTFHQRKWMIFLFFAFITYCPLGDFFHLVTHLRSPNFTSDPTQYGVDYIYGIIGEVVQTNYLMFRIIFWGGGFYIYCRLAEMNKIPTYYAAILFFISHVLLFCYARVSISMVIYFYGLSFLCYINKKNYFRNLFLGILFIAFSRLFHVSSLIMIVATLGIIIPLKKWMIPIILVLIPIIAFIVREHLFLYMESNLADDYLVHKFNRYANNEISIGIARKVIDTFGYGSIYIPMLLSTICIFFKNKYCNIPISIVRMYKVTFVIIIISISFLFFGSSFYTFYYRVLYMAMVPLTIIIIRLCKDGYMSRKYFLWSVIPSIPYHLLKNMYNIYLVDLGIG